ncbi:unnamed protein product [Vicia faba]|uniref:TF-B3 domain-containing protein n=1 Tax=Vicia faba TaxID=3906 RepID=A0AAV1AXJ7_VICFA|nr:unnamed protein product [Vicia faba]
MPTDHDQSLIRLEAYVMFFEINSNQVNLEDVGVHQQHDNNVIVQNSHFNRLYYNAKLLWKKEITRVSKGGKNVMNIPAEIVRKNFRADQTALSLIDLDKMEYYDCQILKGKKPHTEMYLKNGWYEYSKSKNFNVDDNLIFHYRSDSKRLYVKLERKRRKMNIPAEIVRKNFRADQTALSLIDLDKMEYYDCQILKGKKSHTEMYLKMHPKPDPELVQFTGGSASIVQSHTLGLQDQNRDNNAEENLTEDEEDDDVEEIDMMHVDHDPMDNEVSARKGAEFRERLMNEVNRPYCEEECNRLGK